MDVAYVNKVAQLDKKQIVRGEPIPVKVTKRTILDWAQVQGLSVPQKYRDGSTEDMFYYLSKQYNLINSRGKNWLAVTQAFDLLLDKGSDPPAVYDSWVQCLINCIPFIYWPANIEELKPRLDDPQCSRISAYCKEKMRRLYSEKTRTPDVVVEGAIKLVFTKTQDKENKGDKK